MNNGSASLRAAVWVSAAFAASALLCVALLRSAASPWLLLMVAAAHTVACAAALGGLWGLRRGLQRTAVELMAQIEAAGQGRLGERVQSGAEEWAPVSRALNVAVVRLAAQITDRDRRLGELQTEVSVDELTGLAARAQFMDRLVGLLHGPDVGATGGVALLRIDDLGGVNQRTGRDRTDELLRSVATLLRTRSLRLCTDGALVARLNGSDFAVVVPQVAASALDTWTKELSDALRGLQQQQLTDRPRVGWLAASVFHPGETPGAVLSRVDRALQAAQSGNTAWQMVRATRSGPAVSIAQWRGVLDDALNTGRIDLIFADAFDARGHVHHRIAQVRLTQQDSRVFAEDEVLPAALRTARVADIDLRVAELALAHLAEGDAQVLVRMSVRSAERPSFVSRLEIALTEAGERASRLWVAIDPSGEPDLVGVLAPLAETFARHQVRLGLDQIHSPPDDLAPLRRLKVGFLRLAPAMAQGLAGDGSSGKRLLLQLIAQIGETEGMQVIVATAATPADASVVRDLGMPCPTPDSAPAAQAEATPAPRDTNSQRSPEAAAATH